MDLDAFFFYMATLFSCCWQAMDLGQTLTFKNREIMRATAAPTYAGINVCRRLSTSTTRTSGWRFSGTTSIALLEVPMVE